MLRLEVVVSHPRFSSRGMMVYKSILCGLRQEKRMDNEALNEIWAVAVRMKKQMLERWKKGTRLSLMVGIHTF